LNPREDQANLERAQIDSGQYQWASSEMRILHTIDSLNPKTGGPARTVPALVSALVENGVEVDLWARDLPDTFTPPPGVEVRTGSLEAWLTRGTSRPDVWHDHGIWLRSNHETSRLADRFDIPRVVSPRGMLEPWALGHRRWKKKLAWELYQRADLRRAAALHATAQTEADQFRRLGLRNPITVIPNGIDVPRFEGVQDSCAGGRTALFLSRVHTKKGLPLLVEAWARVRPEGWRMKVVGPDENGHVAVVKALVQRAGLAETWEFCEEVGDQEKWDAYRQANLFILPTHSENFGMVVAEALAAGVPVITTRGCPWEGLLAHGCGWWVEPTAEGLAVALQDACSQPDEALRSMGRRGFQWMESEFGWTMIAQRMTPLYEAVLRRPKA
jgi:glycosyltransferase involved in cell wall biosynthesis